MSRSLENSSIIELNGYYGGECSYCYKSGDGRIAFGMSAVQLTVEDYQDLIDRGWRRSGTYLYKPASSNPKCCCQQIPIRLNVTQYKESKTHKRLLKKFNNYISTGIVKSKNSSNTIEKVKEKVEELKTKQVSKLDVFLNDLKCSIQVLVLDIIKSTNELQHIFKDSDIKEKYLNHIQIKPTPHKDNSHHSFKFSFSLLPLKKNKECKDIIIENISNQLVSRFNSSNSNLSFHIGINHFINIKEEISSTIPINDINIEKKKPEVSNTTNTAIDINNDTLMGHRLEVTINSPQCNEEVFALYKKYQTIVHKESDTNKRGFTRFLVDSPLINVNIDSKNNGILNTRNGVVSIPESGFGSFHQCYRIDGKLVAVGVIDILPNCLSSVYFFYDPDYNFISLGNLSALYEIKWVQSISKTAHQLKYYYMGYYIHTCPKMKYKGGYQPSQLLCLSSLQWAPFKDAVEKLDKNNNKYTAFITQESSKPKEITDKQISELKILYASKVCKVSALKKNDNLYKFLREYYENTGDVLGKEILIKLQ